MANRTIMRSIADVLAEDLRGIVGRTKLLHHLKQVPEFNGAPTHRRIGIKIMFRPEDITTLIESLECPCQSSSGKAANRSISAEPSEDRAYTNALERLTRSRQRLTEQNGRRNSGKKRSMASALS